MNQDETMVDGNQNELNNFITQKQKKIFQNNERGKFVQLKILGQGECFGEEEILKKRGVEYLRIYRVTCISEFGTLYAVPKKSLLRLLPQHPTILRVMLAQTKNKEQARLIRLQQLSKMSYTNEEIGIDGKIFKNNDIPVQDTFKSQPHLLVNFNKQKQIETTLSKKIKLAKNCDLTENLYEKDDHNYLIFHSKIASNTYLPKNPKLRKEDCVQNEQGQVSGKGNFLIEEIDKVEFLKILEIQNADIDEHETRLTLLYDESLKKKKHNFNQKHSSIFEADNLKDFSARFNIPASELRPTSHKIVNQESLNLAENSQDQILERRKTVDFLVKVNMKKNLLYEHSKSIFHNTIYQQEGNTRGSLMSINAPILHEGQGQRNVEYTPRIQSQRSPDMSFYSNSNNSLKSPLNNIHSDRKVPLLKLDEILGVNSSTLKTATDHMKNNFEHSFGNNKHGQLFQNTISKSFMNNTPRTQKSTMEVFKFLKPEYNYPQLKKRSIHESQTLPIIQRKSFAQLNNGQSIIQSETDQRLIYPPNNEKCNSLQISDISKADKGFIQKQSQKCQSDRRSISYDATSETFSRNISPSSSISKFHSPMLNQQPYQQSITNGQQTNKNAQQSSSFVNSPAWFINHNHNNLPLKTAAEELFKSKLPQSVRIKKFQLSCTFKNQDNNVQSLALMPLQSNKCK